MNSLLFVDLLDDYALPAAAAPAANRQLCGDVTVTQNVQHHQHQQHPLNAEHRHLDYALPPIDSFLDSKQSTWSWSPSSAWNSPEFPDIVHPWVIIRTLTVLVIADILAAFAINTSGIYPHPPRGVP